MDYRWVKFWLVVIHVKGEQRALTKVSFGHFMYMDLCWSPPLQEDHTMLTSFLMFPFRQYDGGIFKAELGLLCRKKDSANIGV